MHVTFVSLLLCCAALAQQTERPAAAPQPIDFQQVDRTPPKLPASDAARLYGIYLFEQEGERRVWAVLEGAAERHGPTLLYFDVDGDGDLTESGERFRPSLPARPRAAATADVSSRSAATSRAVTSRTRTSRSPDGEHRRALRLMWRGDKVSFGGYGPSRDVYAAFADSPQKAPVFVPGWDRPFEFGRWIAEPLKRSGETDFKVFVGSRGDRVGAFTAVDDEFLPAGEFAVATLHYRGVDGKPRTERFELKERC
jgi:hypothetical protein